MVSTIVSLQHSHGFIKLSLKGQRAFFRHKGQLAESMSEGTLTIFAMGHPVPSPNPHFGGCQ